MWIRFSRCSPFTAKLYPRENWPKNSPTGIIKPAINCEGCAMARFVRGANAPIGHVRYPARGLRSKSDIPDRMSCICDDCVRSREIGGSMQIRLATVMVDNQDNALRFYTTILGFVKNKDIPMGPFR